MKNLRRSALATVAFAILVGVLVLSRPSTSLSDSFKDVRVVNTSAQAVPVSVQGTAGVSGTIQAQQSGPWNVDINGTPTVMLAPGASVSDADHPARQPFQLRAFVSLPEGVADRTENVEVPSGKRFVIEYVSGFGNIPTDQKIVNVSIYTRGAGGPELPVPHFFIPTFTGNYSGTDENFVISAQTRLYTDGGLIVQANRNGTSGNGNFKFSLSGYLVDVP